MKPKQDTKTEADKLVRDIKRATRRKFNAEEKIWIVLAGLRGEDSIAGYCQLKPNLAGWTCGAHNVIPDKSKAQA